MSASKRPFSQASENNKTPILAVLEAELGDAARVLEIGSGTGQHAVFFATRLPQVQWLTSDLAENHAGIRGWIAHSGPPNVEPPFELNALAHEWPALEVDAVFSANTAHIMSWPAAQAMVRGVGRLLCPGAPFLLYGPFRYGGEHTAASNAAFDRMLQARDTAMGVRDVDDLKVVAAEAQMELAADHAMPANNRTLVWRKMA